MSQLGERAGRPVDFLIGLALHQVLVAVLVILLLLTTVVRRWRWQYAVSGMTFSIYVGFGMASRFVAGLETIRVLQSQNLSSSNDVLMLYWYGLAAAASYFGMILALRKANGKLVSARTVGFR